MLKDVVEVGVRQGFRLSLRFLDGAEGEVDVSALVRFEGVFSDLRDPLEFAKVRVDHELGTIRWPGGADLDPDVLYAEVTGRPIELARRAPASDR